MTSLASFSAATAAWNSVEFLSRLSVVLRCVLASVLSSRQIVRRSLSRASLLHWTTWKEGAVRQHFFRAKVDPTCAVAGDMAYPFALLLSKHLQEPHEDLLAVIFTNPNDLAASNFQNGTFFLSNRNGGYWLLPLASFQGRFWPQNSGVA